MTSESSLLNIPGTTSEPGQLLTPPSTHPSSPEPFEPEDGLKTKKKKKKKAKKPASAKDAPQPQENVPPPLCISRNKHWRFISSYHGPWLQLPTELLESLLIVNMDPGTLQQERHYFNDTSFVKEDTNPPPRLGDRGYLEEARLVIRSSPPSFASGSDRPIPPPVDPGVFQSVAAIRRLIDEASELAVRASSGLSAAALNALRGGDSHMMPGHGGGRNTPMSATRIHRLRVLACQKIAAAYRHDEVACSVMVMQGGSVFDDIAQRVLRADPHDIDARYVHFFHEKIPSRQVAEFTTTQLLDELISAQPHRLEFYRTRGVVHCFRDEYALANKDFTYVVKESRAQRKTRTAHRMNVEHGNRKRKKSRGKGATYAHDFVDEGEVEPTSGSERQSLVLHPSVMPDAPDPIETQCLFLRGGAFLQHAVTMLETAALALEGVTKAPTLQGLDLRLSYLENSRYGGVEMGHPDGPLGPRNGPKSTAYRAIFGSSRFRDQVISLARKSVRDFDRFIATFDSRVMSTFEPHGDFAERIANAFTLSDSRRSASNAGSRASPTEPPAMMTTYHPLLVEAHFSVLLGKLIIGNFADVASTFVHAADVVDGLEGYPVFLPPRSMAQAEFIEILDRLSSGWRIGTRPHSLSRRTSTHLVRHGKAAAIPAVVTPPSPPLSAVGASLSMGSMNSSNADPSAPSASSSHSIVSLIRRDTNDSDADAVQFDLRASLDSARMLLAPIVQQRRQKAEHATNKKRTMSNGGELAKVPLQIPLHGPRVEIILAWLGAIHIPELDSVADL